RRRRDRVRRAARALLHRRRLGLECRRQPNGAPALHAGDGGVDAEDRAARRRRDELALLTRRRPDGRPRDTRRHAWAYSARSAVIGEIAAARPAGMSAATSAHAPSAAAATASANGSQNDTP